MTLITELHSNTLGNCIKVKGSNFEEKKANLVAAYTKLIEQIKAVCREKEPGYRFKMSRLGTVMRYNAALTECNNIEDIEDLLGKMCLFYTLNQEYIIDSEIYKIMYYEISQLKEN